MTHRLSDSKDLAETGWGVIFAGDTDPVRKEALSPLLRARQTEAGALFKLYEGTDGYQPGENKYGFLQRHGNQGGMLNPENDLPYYILLVGSPEEIPFEFQRQLDIQYAVGRLHFDRMEQFATYAQNVIAAEQHSTVWPGRISFFCPQTKTDSERPSAIVHLVQPLTQKLRTRYPDCRVTIAAGEQATETRLKQLLGDLKPTTLLFIVVREDPNSETIEAMNMAGSIVIIQDDYSAGVAAADKMQEAHKQMTGQARVAQPPQKLLGQPNGALAVVGNTSPVWGYSYHWPGVGSQTGVYESLIARLLAGYSLGTACQYFGRRFAEIGAELYAMRQQIRYGETANPEEELWLTRAFEETGGWVIMGDPAVRLSE